MFIGLKLAFTAFCQVKFNLAKSTTRGILCNKFPMRWRSGICFCYKFPEMTYWDNCLNPYKIHQKRANFWNVSADRVASRQREGQSLKVKESAPFLVSIFFLG